MFQHRGQLFRRWGQPWGVTLHLRLSQRITKGHVRDISGFLLSEENDFQARFWTHP